MALKKAATKTAKGTSKAAAKKAAAVAEAATPTPSAPRIIPPNPILTNKAALGAPHAIVGLVDVNSSAHRVFQQWYSLTTKMGMKIDLKNYLKKQSEFVLNLAMTAVPPSLAPSYSHYEHRAIACFDAGAGGRDQVLPQYKAQRPTEKPEGLEESFEAFRTAIGNLGDKVLTLPADKAATNAEADDMLATAAAICKVRGSPSVIITGDRDMLQLVDDANMCVVYDTLKKCYFDEAAAQKRMGVLPRDLLAYKILAGDQSDNITGCEGVGPTRAAKLVNKYRTIDAIIANGQHDAEFPQKVRDALRAFAPQVDIHQQVMELQVRTEFEDLINAFLDRR